MVLEKLTAKFYTNLYRNYVGTIDENEIIKILTNTLLHHLTKKEFFG